MKYAALYARVSTLIHGQDPELQLRELREYCKKHDLLIVGEYVDRVSSGKLRPQLERLLQEAEFNEDKKFDTVLVWKFDRVARSSIELCTILERLKAVKVSFVSLTEQIDTDTPAGKLVFTVLSAVAEMERALIRERVRAGLRNAVAKGRRLGHPPCLVTPAEFRAKVEELGSVRLAGHVFNIGYTKARSLYRESKKT